MPEFYMICGGGFNGRPLAQWPTGPLPPGVVPAQRTIKVAFSL